MPVMLGPVTSSSGGARDAAWKPLREPDAELKYALSFPLAFSVSTAVLVLWLLSATTLSEIAIDPLTLVVAFAVLAPLHELAHAAAFPRSTGARPATIAFRPSQFLLTARYSGELSRNRYLCVLAMPFVAISVVPIVAFAMLGYGWSQVALISLLNALISSGDVLTIILVLAQVPPDAVIRNQGDTAVWKTRGSPIRAARGPAAIA